MVLTLVSQSYVNERSFREELLADTTSQEFGIGEGETEGAPNQVRDSWLVGLVNAGPYIGR